ncbi:MAG: HAD-IC family P-type ATPase [Peptostreptococcaceae bacterium]
MNNNTNRFNPMYREGLTSNQVQERIDKNLINTAIDNPSKTIKEIIVSNTFTFFNLLNLVLASLVILVKSYKNALFMGIVVSNTLIGIIQEVRAKKTIDKLSLVSSSSIKVIRDSKPKDIHINDIVLDDIIELKVGNEIPVDCIVVDGEVEVNESLLTGEPDAISKTKGDTLLSGSFIVSGSCYCRADKVGADSYAAKLTSEVKKRKRVNSELMNALNKIIKTVAIVIVPIGLALFLKSIYIVNVPIKLSVITTVAALIGMVPEGLYLLTSIALYVSVVRLGKNNVLVQELYCIESLARVDLICLDKTGTITEGIMEVKEIEVLNDSITIDDINNIGYNFVKAVDDNNSTFNAMKNYFNSNINWNCANIVPFSSSRKWSGAAFNEYGTYIIGAPEFVLKGKYSLIKDKVEVYSTKGERVLLLVKVEDNMLQDTISGDITSLALIIIKDKIRDNVNETFDFFYNEGVDIKVISGDSPVTVSEIARQSGIKNANKYIDVSTIKTDDELENIADEFTVFGRVKPEQKRLIIKSLKKNGHTVAMTGDGVNDVLALKDSDCSIAMASGSDAARRTAMLVLTDSNFKCMPGVVMEGRRVINNIERSASLFLTKTIYSFLLSLLFIFLPYNYPFVPIQLTLINALTIGIPSFFFTFERNRNIIKKGFLKNILIKSSIGAFTIVFNIILIMLIHNKVNFNVTELSSIVATITGIVGLIILLSVCEPLTKKRLVLVLSMTTCFIFILLIFGSIFSIYNVSLLGKFIIFLLLILDYPIIFILRKLIRSVLR